MSLVPKPLRPSDCDYLAKNIRRADLLDLTIHGENPRDALLHGIEHGEAYGVWDGPQLIGAGGWTKEGAVWTLWREGMTKAQSRELLKQCVPWARIMAIRAKRPLSNVFLSNNRVTERWLRATRCVDILDDVLIPWQGRLYVPFHLKALEDLPYV